MSMNTMRKAISWLGMVLALAGCVCCKGNDPVMGSWEGHLPYDGMAATSMIFSRGDNGEAKVVTLWRWGSPQECVDVKVSGDEFSFRHPANILYRGHVCKDVMMAEVAKCDESGKPTEEFKSFVGWRNPEIEAASTDEAEFGEPIDLLASGLEGFSVLGDAKAALRGWSLKDGVLSNRVEKDANGKRIKPGVNIVTRRADFYDFKIDYDVRMPKGANSGVYLRGRYEIQSMDSYGLPVDKHNMAAYYGRVTPSVAAEKPAGEWQHVTAVLYKRHLTVILNGVRIIDNAEVVGVTGGAIDADEFVPGPIYLQGDHTDADYRNMVIRKAL